MVVIISSGNKRGKVIMVVHKAVMHWELNIIYGSGYLRQEKI